VEQRRGQDDQKEAYRENLIGTSVSTIVLVVGRARVCATATRTKDSPMMVLMPAILVLPVWLHNIVVGVDCARWAYMHLHVPDGVMTLFDLRVMVVG
jgi:hypothetical protein